MIALNYYTITGYKVGEEFDGEVPYEFNIWASSLLQAVEKASKNPEFICVGAHLVHGATNEALH